MHDCHIFPKNKIGGHCKFMHCVVFQSALFNLKVNQVFYLKRACLSTYSSGFCDEVPRHTPHLPFIYIRKRASRSGHVTRILTYSI